MIAGYARFRFLGRRLSFRFVLANIRKLSQRIDEDSSFSPEAIIAVNRSGAIAGAVLSGLLTDLTVRAPLVVPIKLERRDGQRVTSILPAVPNLTDLSRILVLSCVNDTGSGLIAVLDWINEKYPRIVFRTAAVYSNSTAIIQPNYVGESINPNARISARKLETRMPWMVSGWHHDLPAERLIRS